MAATATDQSLLDAGGLTPGQQMAETRELWSALQWEGPRIRTPFGEDR
jgi:hypothetical protein